MEDLANDPRTLSISTGPTFRQKGEAFYSQLRRRYIPKWMFEVVQNQMIYGQGFYWQGMQNSANQPYLGMWGQQATPPDNLLAGLFGSIGSGGIGH